MAKICHENQRILYVLTIKFDELTIKGVNFDTICEGIGCLGHIMRPPLIPLLRGKSVVR